MKKLDYNTARINKEVGRDQPVKLDETIVTHMRVKSGGSPKSLRFQQRRPNDDFDFWIALYNNIQNFDNKVVRVLPDLKIYFEKP